MPGIFALMALKGPGNSGAELAALTADLPAHSGARPPTCRDVLTGVGVLVAAISVLATILLTPGITAGMGVDVAHRRRRDRRRARSRDQAG